MEIEEEKEVKIGGYQKVPRVACGFLKKDGTPCQCPKYEKKTYCAEHNKVAVKIYKRNLLTAASTQSLEASFMPKPTAVPEISRALDLPEAIVSEVLEGERKLLEVVAKLKASRPGRHLKKEPDEKEVFFIPRRKSYAIHKARYFCLVKAGISLFNALSNVIRKKSVLSERLKIQQFKERLIEENLGINVKAFIELAGKTPSLEKVLFGEKVKPIVSVHSMTEEDMNKVYAKLLDYRQECADVLKENDQSEESVSVESSISLGEGDEIIPVNFDAVSLLQLPSKEDAVKFLLPQYQTTETRPRVDEALSKFDDEYHGEFVKSMIRLGREYYLVMEISRLGKKKGITHKKGRRKLKSHLTEVKEDHLREIKLRSSITYGAILSTFLEIHDMQMMLSNSAHNFLELWLRHEDTDIKVDDVAIAEWHEKLFTEVLEAIEAKVNESTSS